MKYLLLLLALAGCATATKEDQELLAILASLHTPEMNEAIRQAQPGVPTKK